jgi:hypothetical protein
MSTKIDDIIRAARTRIRLRNTVQGVIAGGTVGLIVAFVGMATSRLIWLPMPDLGGLAIATSSAVIGAVIGLTRPILSSRELALLLDRALGTDEALVTLLHLEQSEHVLPAVRADLERRVAGLPAARSGLRVQLPRVAIWIPLLIAATVLLWWLPSAPPPWSGPLKEDIQRIADILEQHHGALPEAARVKLQAILEDLENGSMSPQEAADALADLQRALKDSEPPNAQRDHDALADAAAAIEQARLPESGQKSAAELADALRDLSSERMADAGQGLADALDAGSASDRAQAAQALAEAAQALDGAASPDLQSLGETLDRAARALQDTPQRSASDALRELQQKTSDDMRAMRERLAQDRERMREVQEANGALEGARQRLAAGGTEDEPAEGEGSSGEATQGTAGGTIGAVGEGGPSTAGAGHTWEDEGTHDTTSGHLDADRQGHRTQGVVANDFESFYDPQRLVGAEGLIVSVDGLFDERGQYDVIESQRTDGKETARRRLFDVPDTYIEAAERSLADDRVPPGYRAALKDYFDTME